MASLRRQINSIPECADGSPAWTIHGWSAPKLRLLARIEYSYSTHDVGSGGNLLRNDNCSLEDAGVNTDSIIAPLYDSSCYSEPVVDWDFYQGSCPDGGTTAVQLSDACAAVQQGGEQIQRGTASFFAGLTGGGLCGSPGGAGIAVEQDPETLRFCVTHIAPCGPADSSDRVCVGDIIFAIDGRLCADATGLDPAQVAELRRMCSRSDGGWLAALQGEEERAIASPEALRKALSGPPGSWVTVALRRSFKSTSGGEARMVEVRLQRHPLRHYAGDYM